MIELKDLLEDGEVIVEYHLHNEYWSRNCLGKLEPRIGKYFIQRNSKGKYEIMKNEHWYITNAAIANEVMLWLDIEPFDSMVKTYAWLKKHVNELL